MTHFLPQSRITRDLLWIGAFALAASLPLLLGGLATAFIVGYGGVWLALGFLGSALWVEYRLYSVEKSLNDRRKAREGQGA